MKGIGLYQFLSHFSDPLGRRPYLFNLLDHIARQFLPFFLENFHQTGYGHEGIIDFMTECGGGLCDYYRGALITTGLLRMTHPQY
jgi:hypothetical protein